MAIKNALGRSPGALFILATVALFETLQGIEKPAFFWPQILTTFLTTLYGYLGLIGVNWGQSKNKKKPCDTNDFVDITGLAAKMPFWHAIRDSNPFYVVEFTCLFEVLTTFLTTDTCLSAFRLCRGASPQDGCKCSGSSLCRCGLRDIVRPLHPPLPSGVWKRTCAGAGVVCFLCRSSL